MDLRQQRVAEWELKISKAENRKWKKWHPKLKLWTDEVGYEKEDTFLADCMGWLRDAHPELSFAVFHIANEGSSESLESRMRGSKNLTIGVLSGVPDVCSVWKGCIHWIEFKLPGRGLTGNQPAIHKLWESFGLNMHICDNFKHWKFIIEKLILG